MSKLPIFVLGMSMCGFLGCSVEGSENKEEDAVGLELPELAENQIRISGPSVERIAPGEDITYCTYLDWYAPRDLSIVESIGFQSRYGGHHVTAFGVANSQPPGTTTECTEADMTNAIGFLGGGGPDAQPLTMPNGVALKLAQGTQVMLQHHWINTTSDYVDGASAVDLTLAPDGAELEQAGMFLNTNTTFSIPPGSEASAVADCTIPEEMKIFMLGGHEHKRGTGVKIAVARNGGEPELIYDSQG